VALVLRAGDEEAPSPSEATVVRVVDGDTIRVRLATGAEEAVRYIGIDTPERGDCFFQEATDENARLIEGKRVRLERDVSERDRFGRLLAYVYRAEDDLFVNGELVRSGFADAKRYDPDTRLASTLERLEEDARRLVRGLWGRC
jgi:micrococcal nuclease